MSRQVVNNPPIYNPTLREHLRVTPHPRESAGAEIVKSTTSRLIVPPNNFLPAEATQPSHPPIRCIRVHVCVCSFSDWSYEWMVRPAKGGTEFPEPSSWKTIPHYTFTHSVPKGAYVRYLLFRTCSVHGCVRLCTTSVPTQLLSTLDLPPKVSNTCVHAQLQPTTGASDLAKT